MTSPNTRIRQITFIKNELLVWNDIIYTFRHIRRGKGFDPLDTSSELAQTIQEYYYKYPYLFIVGENGNLYPSRLGFELGRKLQAYIKTNRVPKKLNVFDFEIIIE
mgnify:CR=1 FL=1